MSPLHPVVHHPAPTVPRHAAVIAEGTLLDDALCALITASGWSATRVDRGSRSPVVPRVVLVRSPAAVRYARSQRAFDHAVLIGIDVRAGDPAGLDIPDSPQAAHRLTAFLATLAGHTAPTGPAVRVTDRECEILTTYAMGSTMAATARRYHVAESTVQQHYRRVTQRYRTAGVPINNKAQLLLQFIADGRVKPSDLDDVG
ncbi:MAG: LuxR C-terminal-related transcriptional regulator [Gordonia sp. (in: high G+C Gram-positive bacteria)]